MLCRGAWEAAAAGAAADHVVTAAACLLPPPRYPPARLAPALPFTRAAAVLPPAALAADAGDAPHKPQLGKNPHSEGPKTKRELQHDHHLSRKGKGACGLRVACRAPRRVPALQVAHSLARQPAALVPARCRAAGRGCSGGLRLLLALCQRCRCCCRCRHSKLLLPSAQAGGVQWPTPCRRPDALLPRRHRARQEGGRRRQVHVGRAAGRGRGRGRGAGPQRPQLRLGWVLVRWMAMRLEAAVPWTGRRDLRRRCG